jgi:hypothetical protein
MRQITKSYTMFLNDIDKWFIITNTIKPIPNLSYLETYCDKFSNDESVKVSKHRSGYGSHCILRLKVDTSRREDEGACCGGEANSCQFI